MPNRHGDDNQYRYGFNGMEKDDELKSIDGGSYTTEFRQYDPRIGRWLSIDPKADSYPSSSPYSSFNNNPIFYIDPSGSDGKVTVDKETKTVQVEVNFYFDKSDENLKRFAITEDFHRSSDGEIFKSDVTKMHESGFESKNGSKITVDGVEYSINYKINFIGLENAQAVENKLKEDKTANAFVYNENLISEGKSVAGVWNPNNRTLSLGMDRRDDGSTLTHEIGHSMGLPHSTDIPNTSHYGCEHDCPNQINNNGDKDSNGSIMSYAHDREIDNAEIKMTVSNSIRLANTVKDKIVTIHLKGSENWKPVIIK